MTIHFFYFILDMILWGVLGAGSAYLVQSFERLDKLKKEKNRILFLISAFLTGCFAVMIHGLPETGLSFYSIFSVLLVDVGLAFFLSPNLLSTVKKSNTVRIAQNTVSSLILLAKDQSRELLRTRVS